MDESPDLHEISEAARRGLQRAGIHLMKAAIEVVAGIGAFLEEINTASPDADEQGEGSGPQHIPVD